MKNRPTLVGHTLADRYRVDSEVARGGMATVYRAHDVRLERDVALKVLAPPYAADASFVERFLGEGRAAASLSHPSLVHVYDSGSDGDAHYIVMELLERHRTLRERLDVEGPLAPAEVARIGRELLAGLKAVHDRGLVHCDVKPGNVMLGAGPAKLIDFGIATPPHDGIGGETSIGSLRFMSPEQLHGDALTPASDLFSLGAVLYDALTGRPPFPGETPEEVSAAQSAGNVRPPSTLADGVPATLDLAILQTLRRDPAERFSSADAMAASLSAATEEGGEDDTTQVVRVPTPPPQRPGYVPPAAPPPPQPPAQPVRRAPPPAPPRRDSGSVWGWLGTLLILGAAALVVALIVVPLLELGRQEGSATPSAQPTSEPGSNTVLVPDLVGQPTADALQAAGEAGLDWTLYCNEDQDQPAGIIDQEPPGGTPVAQGSTFSLYSARFSDCQ
jgi:eukaryotic-like serine/threonine-protein kinase